MEIITDREKRILKDVVNEHCPEKYHVLFQEGHTMFGMRRASWLQSWNGKNKLSDRLIIALTEYLKLPTSAFFKPQTKDDEDNDQ